MKICSKGKFFYKNDTITCIGRKDSRKLILEVVDEYRLKVGDMGDFTDVDISEGLAMKKSIQKMEVDVLAAMTGI